MTKDNRIVLYLSLVLLLIIFLTLFFVYGNKNLNNTEEPDFCTEEAKLCPDGSYVSRNPDLNCEFDLCPEGNMNFCNSEDRETDVCTEIYQPVCGWSDPEKIQCIKYPCAQTYSNSCSACINPDVLYWVNGECPK